ncbi:MAG: hypothetical protein JO257_03270 [Deltaproteobacteria bacterium]|nr:hypothetical protein [Deltaproteobacteria bacterium]
MTRTAFALILLAMSTAPALADAPRPDRAVYRLDFELTTTQPGKPTTTTSFSLNVAEDRHGEAIVADTRVEASFTTQAGALLLDVDTSMHKMATKGAALAQPGKKALVAAIDHDKAHTELSVTPTRL